MPDARKTLTRYTIEMEHRHPDSTGDFSGLLNAVATAVKMIANQVNKGALVGALGSAESENVQGEVQKQLDVISNEIMVGETEWGGHLAAMASEEMTGCYPVPSRYRRGKYLLVFDPLDGSSNIDVNICGRNHLLDPAQPAPGRRAAGRGLPPARHGAGVRRVRAVRAVHDAGAHHRRRAWTASRWTATSALSC